MNDILIPWFNIALISFCVCVIATWYPSFKKFHEILFDKGIPSRIYWIASGLVLSAFGTLLVRSYSFALREYGLLWLRDSYVPAIAIFTQLIGFLVLAYSYFSPTRQSDLTPMNYRGLWLGGITAVGLILFKVIG